MGGPPTPPSNESAAGRRRGDWRRTHTCGELRAAHVGQTVTINGWVQARRNHGGIYFLDLRDRYGVTQVVLDEKLSATLRLGSEYVLSVRGEVSARAAANVNKDRSTGEIELVATAVEVLSPSRTPAFVIDGDEEVSIETRMKFRYLDLRRPVMLRNLQHRAKLISAMRRAFEAQGFIEVETPILTKATPEGARDYLVPSRVHAGEFYALPQSPQIFKQILMVGGFDKYFQVARCFRDEDLRADRQPEFTQLDMEMSFVEEEDVFAVWEQVMADTFREAMGATLSLPFPRLRWEDAMRRFGVDKPDLRFELELKDVGAWAAKSSFGVFSAAIAQGGAVCGLALPAAHALSRKDIAALEEVAKSLGAQGLAYWKAAREGSTGPLARFVPDAASAQELMGLLGAHDGDTCLFAAGPVAMVRKVLGELRNQLGKRFQLGDRNKLAFAWVTHFPLFEYDADAGRWFSAHHPFTAPEDWTLGGENPDPGSLASRSYDMVFNGWELGSGSVRIHRPDVQERIFQILGIGPEERQRKFGFFVEALATGAPPHAGFAMGLDRIVALSLGLDNIRDVVAFPKTASATDLMCQAPSPVAPEQLAEVHIKTLPAS